MELSCDWEEDLCNCSIKLGSWLIPGLSTVLLSGVELVLEIILREETAKDMGRA